MPRLNIAPIAERLLNSAPEAGDGLNSWLIKGASECQRYGVAPGRAFDLIAATVVARGGQIIERDINKAISKAYSQPYTGETHKRRPDAQYDPAKLERIADRLDFDVTPEWLEERSPVSCWNRTPAGFLHKLYEPAEKVLIFIVYASQGQAFYEHTGLADNFNCLDEFREGCANVWFLNQPVDGEYHWNPREGKESRRSEESIIEWRYMVIESDKAIPQLWLRMLVQAPLPISAIYTSGKRSIHTLIRVDAGSKQEWDQFRDSIERDLVALGADPGALTAVRLTRLPGCRRGETGQLQRLLYLNPEPTNTPIFNQGENNK
jgi:hypothetical protein